MKDHLIKVKKKIGPRNDPCETHALIESAPENWPLKVTYRNLPVEKDFITEKNRPVIQ